MNEILQIKNLNVGFFNRKVVTNILRDITFDLKKGEVLGIIGESGSGKSITCLSVIKLLPYPGKIISGDIIINGMNITNKDDNWMRKNIRGTLISIILQDPMSALNPTYTIGWQMREALILHKTKLKKQESINILIQTLEKMDMADPEELLHKYPHQLSGGMVQRVIIATALLSNPSIIIADEPTTSLDVTTQAKVLDLIIDLRNKMKKSIILVSHDLNLISERCNRCIVMYGGMIMEIADSRKILENSKSPYTDGLVKCIPSLCGDVSFTPIPGDVIDFTCMPLGCPFEPRCFRRIKKCKNHIPPIEEFETNHMVSCFNPL